MKRLKIITDFFANTTQCKKNKEAHVDSYNKIPLLNLGFSIKC